MLKKYVKMWNSSSLQKITKVFEVELDDGNVSLTDDEIKRFTNSENVDEYIHHIPFAKNVFQSLLDFEKDGVLPESNDNIVNLLKVANYIKVKDEIKDKMIDSVYNSNKYSVNIKQHLVRFNKDPYNLNNVINALSNLYTVECLENLKLLESSDNKSVVVEKHYYPKISKTAGNAIAGTCLGIGVALFSVMKMKSG